MEFPQARIGLRRSLHDLDGFFERLVLEDGHAKTGFHHGVFPLSSDMDLPQVVGIEVNGDPLRAPRCKALEFRRVERDIERPYPF